MACLFVSRRPAIPCKPFPAPWKRLAAAVAAALAAFEADDGVDTGRTRQRQRGFGVGNSRAVSALGAERLQLCGAEKDREGAYVKEEYEA